MKKQQVTFDLDQIDNLLDLANFLKYIFHANVRILPDIEKNGLALIADVRTGNCFIKHSEKPVMTVSVFISNKVNVHFHNNTLSFMMKPSVEDIAMEPDHSFDSIQEFIDFLRPSAIPVSFPEIEVESFQEINLEQRGKAIQEWKKELEKLIPYGVQVQNQLDEIITDASWIFQVHLPTRPVPKEIAEKNKWTDEYHSEFDYDHLLSFCPGDLDWNKTYKKIIEHLKTIYSFEKIEQ